MSYQVIYKTELYHHGIKGQKWGKRNGPPYPLDAEDHSSSEKKAGWRTSLNNSVTTTTTTNKSSNDSQNNAKTKKKFKFKLTDKQKKYLKIGAAVAIAGLAVYGAYKYNKIVSAPPVGFIKGFMSTDPTERLKADFLNSINESKEYISFENFSKLTGDEFKSLKSYTGMAFATINSVLRKGINIDSDTTLKTKIDNLKSVMEKTKLEKDVSVFRGIDTSAVIKILGEDIYKKIISVTNKDEIGSISDLKNTVILDKGFMSTSLNKSVAENFVHSNKGLIFNILAKKGAKACAVFDFSAFPSEKEIVFADSSGLKFTGDYKIIDGYIHLFAELVQI